MEEMFTKDNAALAEEAGAFVMLCHAELGKTARETERRLEEIGEAIERTGTYVHTFEELTHGAKMAWRNSNRCIGRLFWDTLVVRDARAVRTEAEAADELLRHIEYATNGGRIRPVVTVFPPSRAAGGAGRPAAERMRILNHQLIRFAGYETPSGIVGDPASVELTNKCLELGWRGAGTPYDALPLVLRIGEAAPRLFEIPERLVLRVPIVHPDNPEIAELGLQWYAVPIVSDMRLEIGGISYTAAPFNGWYMGTEIGARNLADTFRYDMLPSVAAKLGLNTSREATLWRDRALAELNVAVLHSFKTKGVMIVDHHTAAMQFGRFEENERRSGRAVTGEWSWLIPPMSPSATAIFHRHYDNAELTPNFFRQDAGW